MNKFIERQRQHFNDISDVYTAARKHPSHLLLKELIWSHFLLDKEQFAAPNMRVLEPMCGMGDGYQILNHHLHLKFDYLGFDYSEEMVRIARKQLPGERIEWQDATTYIHQGEPFDWIILIGGLHHVFSRSSEVVARLGSSLRTGGYFLSFEPTHNCWLTRTLRQRIYERNKLFDAQTEQGFDLDHLDAMFERVGFEKVDQVFPGLLAYVLYYNPDAFPALNVGGKLGVQIAFFFDRLLWRTWVAKKISFATITLWKRR